MSEVHKHRINATFMMQLLDYQTFTVGCEICGPQWVVTVNWYDATLAVSWVNEPIGFYYDSADRSFVFNQAEEDGPSAPLEK